MRRRNIDQRLCGHRTARRPIGLPEGCAWVVLTAVVLCAMPSACREESSNVAATASPPAQETYVTWSRLEPDKCASAWLIQRFISPGARIQLLPPGEEVVSGIPFDVPGVRWSRTSRYCTFEAILADVDVNDPVLAELSDALRQIEFNPWDLPPGGLAERAREAVGNAIATSASPEDAMEQTFVWFDRVYSDLRRQTASDRR